MSSKVFHSKSCFYFAFITSRTEYKLSGKRCGSKSSTAISQPIQIALPQQYKSVLLFQD